MKFMKDSSGQKHTGLNIFLGILLVIIGLFAIGSVYATTFISVYLFGWILLFAGIVQFFHAFFAGSFARGVLSILGGILAFVVGLIIISNPTMSAVTFTFLVAFLLLISGTYKMISSAMNRNSHWGWAFFGGAISLLLGISILAGWPVAGLWVIGLFIGIELLINGFQLMFNVTPSMETYSNESQYLAGTKGGRAKEEKKDE